MPKAHVTHIRSNKRGSTRPFTVVCSCGWKGYPLDYVEAQEQERAHKQVAAWHEKEGR